MKLKYKVLKWKKQLVRFSSEKLICKFQSDPIHKEGMQFWGTESNAQLLICDVISIVFNAYKKKGVKSSIIKS